MPPFAFTAVALLIAAGGVLLALFPKAVHAGRTGDESGMAVTRNRLLFDRALGVIGAALGLVLAFDPSLVT